MAESSPIHRRTVLSPFSPRPNALAAWLPLKPASLKTSLISSPVGLFHPCAKGHRHDSLMIVSGMVFIPFQASSIPIVDLDNGHFDYSVCFFKAISILFFATSAHFFTMKDCCGVKIASTRTKPAGNATSSKDKESLGGGTKLAVQDGNSFFIK